MGSSSRWPGRSSRSRASCNASRRPSRHSSLRTSTRHWTIRRRNGLSGMPSRRLGRGGPSCPRTSAASPRSAGRVLRDTPTRLPLVRAYFRKTHGSAAVRAGASASCDGVLTTARLDGSAREAAPRILAGLALAVALGVYSALAEELPSFRDEVDVLFVALLVVPATFALVWLALPLRARLGQWGVAGAAGGAALLAVLFSLTDLDIAANFAKLAAATFMGWWFLSFFEAAWWVLLVALLIVPSTSSQSRAARPRRSRPRGPRSSTRSASSCAFPVRPPPRSSASPTFSSSRSSWELQSGSGSAGT